MKILKVIWAAVRWYLGVTFCLTSIVDFTDGDIALAIFILIIGLLLLPPVTEFLFKRESLKQSLLLLIPMVLVLRKIAELLLSPDN